MNRFKKFIFNGLLLTAVSLIMRTVSVSFNVYISNTVGAEAMGLFTLISTVYGFAITFATSGVNLASTRLVSEALGKLHSNDNEARIEKTPQVRKAIRKCIFYCLFFGSLASFVLFICAPGISISLLKDKRCISSLRALSLTLTPISVSSALNGYFTAVRKAYKNAFAQVFEQMVKIFSCSLLLSRFFANDVESACLCIVAGSVIAELFSFVMHAVMYLLEKSDRCRIKQSKVAEGEGLLKIALPVAFSAYLRSGLITVEHILIPWGLERSGAARDISLAAYGTIHSMVFPVVFFPSAILSSFAGLIVPELSQANAEKKYNDINRIVLNVFETSLIFSIGAAGIMIFFSYELGKVIYPASDAGVYIKMIAPLIPIMYLDTSVDAMLKGLGEQVYSMGVNIVDSMLSVILVIILLPKFGITGYIMTVYFTETVNATLSITRLLQVSKIKPLVISRVIKPLAAVILSSLCVKHLNPFSIIPFASSAAELLINICLTVALYLLFVMIFGALKPSKIKKAVKLLQFN